MGDALVAASLWDDDADGIILIAKASSFISAKPKSHKETMRKDSVRWGAAKARELEKHRKNKTFLFINRSTTTSCDARRKRLVPLTWVMYKKNARATSKPVSALLDAHSGREWITMK